MKRAIILIAISLFLIGFIGAIGITGSAVDNSTGEGNPAKNGRVVDNSTGEGNQNQPVAVNSEEEVEEETDNGEGATLREQVRERLKVKLNDSQIKKLIQVKNRLMAQNQVGECPEKCTCTGSATKCMFANGTREMTITAGKSGNVIIQAKGINASTQVTLYKSEDGKIYAVKKNNETKEIRMLPDQVRERIQERIERKLENENITLNEDGTYNYNGEKKKRLFFFIPIKVRVKAQIDAETGEVIIEKQRWWEFLASDNGEQIVGASCGTVTPGYNDQCCQTKGYNIWNMEEEECKFLEE